MTVLYRDLSFLPEKTEVIIPKYTGLNPLIIA